MSDPTPIAPADMLPGMVVIRTHPKSMWCNVPLTVTSIEHNSAADPVLQRSRLAAVSLGGSEFAGFLTADADDWVLA